MKRLFIYFFILIAMLQLAACGGKEEAEVIESEGIVSPEIRYNTYDTLNVATYVTRIDGIYFIVDCYHDQIIYNENLTDPLTEWKILTDEVHYAHTIAGDGEFLVTDDTENNRLLVFTRQGDGYVHSQTLENIGMKPHYVQYDEARGRFLAWSSITGELYYIEKDADTDSLDVVQILQIPELYGVYVRSFTVIGDDIYFVSGHNNGKIIRASLDTLEIQETYPVPSTIAGMVQLTFIDDDYYITVSTDSTENQSYATILRTQSLESLIDGDYEDIYSQFGISGGTPYYITNIDGIYYLSHHRTSENILSFEVIDHEIDNVTVIY